MVIFKEIAWTAEIKQFLTPAMVHDPLNSILSIEADVKSGMCAVIGGFKNNQLVLAFVVRIDVAEFGNELVIVCGASSGHGNTIKSISEFERIARQNGCEYIRIHTALRALGRVLQHGGFEVSEMVLRKRV